MKADFMPRHRKNVTAAPLYITGGLVMFLFVFIMHFTTYDAPVKTVPDAPFKIEPTTTITAKP